MRPYSVKLAVGTLLLTSAPLAMACESDVEDCPAVSLEAALINDFLRNTTGGLERGSEYLNNFDLVGDFDGRKLLNVADLSLHAHVMYNNGRPFGARYVGESQLVSNIESVDTWRLYEFWADYRLGTDDAGASVRFGLYDLNSEFDSLDGAALFINSSHGIGPQLAQTGENGPSIFPVTSAGLRVRGGKGEVYWQTAVLDAVAGDADRPDRTSFDLRSHDGSLVVAEVGAPMAGFKKVAVGAWRYTEPFESIDEVDELGEPLRVNGNDGVYFIAERQMWARDAVDVTAFVRAGTADERVNPIDRYVGGGVVWTGWRPEHRDDQIGFAVAVARNGDRLRAATELAGAPVGGSETVYEATWRTSPTDWLTLQPDLQYVVNPGMAPDVDNAWVVGLRVEVAAGWGQ